MRYDFDTLPQRRGTPNFKWNAYDAGVLPMFVADMDFVSPQPVIDALRRQVDSGLFGYPEGLHGDEVELPAFRRVIVDRMAARYQWHIQPQDIVFLPGIVVGFNIAAYALCAPGEAMLIQPPIYPPMVMAAAATQRRRVDAPLVCESDGTYRIDRDVFEAAITADTRLFLLCNPHNPTGRVFRRDELEKLAEICLKHNIVICSDEIHSDLIYRDQQHIPTASLSPEIADRTITLLAPSKTFNLPGLQCAMAIIPNPDLRQKYSAAKQGLVPWVNLMGLIAGEAAYRAGQEWLDQLLVYLEANRDFVDDFVKRAMPSINMAKPEGTYLAWLDCRDAGIEGSPYQFFLDKARVALGDGAIFGPGGEGFVRLNFACPRSMLTEALERMQVALAVR
ncbi:MAG TPA: MalY/PatB family protein, partial [Anaerolineae bacterium]|nr:MalY/PatB family protein [Anaerolineae bacterium]